MDWLRQLIFRLKRLRQRRRLEAEMQEEIQAHLEREIDTLVQSGLSEAEARTAARRNFGGVEQIKEYCRDEYRLAVLDAFLRDMNFAWRSFSKTPGFTLFAVLIVALGIGATTAMFSTVNALVLRPLPAREPENLVAVYETNLARNVPSFSSSYPNYFDWRERSQSWEELAAVGGEALNLTGKGAEPEFVWGATITANFLPMLGLKPLWGRNFLEQEAKPGGERVAIVSHAFWRRQFGGNADVLGKPLTLNGRPYTLVGILPPGVFVPGDFEIAVPMATDVASEQRMNHELSVYGRLRAGVSISQAEADMQALATQIEREHPGQDKGWSVHLVPMMQDLIAPSLQRSLYLLLGAVGLLLVIACTNFSNLLLVRTLSRHHELALRVALGASRAQIVRQLLTESLVLTVSGGALGVVLSLWIVDTLRALPLPRAAEISVDARVLGVACLVTLLTGLAAAWGPAMKAAKADPQEALKNRSPSSSHRSGLRDGMVVVQVGISLFLLVCAALLGRSFDRLLHVNPGFACENVVTMSLRPLDKDHAASFYERLNARVAALPGVLASGVISSLPLSEGNTSNNVFPVGPSVLPVSTSVQASWRLVDGGYFDAMQIPLIRGRTFAGLSPDDAAGAVVLSASLARSLYGDSDPVGRDIANLRATGERLRVVGVVGDLRSQKLRQEPAPMFYISLHRFIYGPMHLAVRSDGDPTRLRSALRAVVKEIDPEVPIFNERTVEQLRDANLEQEHAVVTLLGAFTISALLLCGLGTYGVIAFGVQQRTQEFGIRLAIGAQSREIVGLVLKHALRLVASGAAVGFALAFIASGFLKPMLFEVGPADPWSYLEASLVLTVVAVVAVAFPALRATKVDPLVALRAE